MATIAEMLIKLGIDASDMTSGAQQSIGKIKEIEASLKTLEKVGAGMEKTGKAITKGVTLPVIGAGAALVKFGSDAQVLKQVERGFNDIAASAGTSGDKVLTALQKSSRGMIANVDLMKSFNQAANLVSLDFAVKLPEAMEYLGKVSASTGQDMDYLLNSLVTGVGRLSPMILDNLNVQVSLNDAYKVYADSIGKSTDQLTKAEQQTAVMNETMRLLQRNTASMSDEFGTSSGRVMTALKNVKDAIGTELIPYLEKGAEKLVPLIDRFGQLFEKGGSLHPVITKVGDTIGKLINWGEKMIDWLEDLNPRVVESATNIALFLAALGPILTIGGKIVKSFGSLHNVFGGLAKMITQSIVAIEGGNLVFMSTAVGAKAAAGGVTTFTVALSTLIPVVIAATAAIAAIAWVIQDNKMYSGYVKELNKVDETVINLNKSYKEWQSNVKATAEVMREQGETVKDNKLETRMLAQGVVELWKAGKISYFQMRQMADGLTGLIPPSEKAKQKVYELITAANGLETTMNNVIPAMEAYGDTLDYQEGLVGFESTKTQLEIITERNKQAREEAQKLREAQAGALQGFLLEMENITSLSSNFGNVISLAQSYTTELANIETAQKRIDALKPFEETGGNIDGVWMSAKKVKEELEGLEGTIQQSEEAMQRMADQMTLNMLQATIAIGGVTKAEAEAYFKMANDMGIISEEAALRAMEAYGNAVDEINEYVIDTKTGLIDPDASSYWAVIDEIESQQFRDKIVELIAEAEQFDETWTAKEALEFGDKVLNVLMESGQFDESFTAIDALKFMGKTIPVELVDLGIQGQLEGWISLLPQEYTVMTELDTTEPDNYQPLPYTATMGFVIDNTVPQSYEPPTYTGTVNMEIGDTSEVVNYTPPTLTGTINYSLGSVAKPGNVTVQQCASGGPVSANTPYLIGEVGPELFVPDTAGTIVPNWQLNMAASSGMDEARLARAVTAGMRELMRERDIERELEEISTDIRGNAFENVNNDWR